jgi:hypothetical protein
VGPLERMRSVHSVHGAKRFEILEHYIFTLHHSTSSVSWNGLKSD